MTMKKETRTSTNIKRARAIFSGRVQGVGFRFTAIDVARSYNVSGFVKNLDDGNVEVVAEGEEDTLKEFIDAIRSGPLCNYIRSVDISYEPPTGRFRDFTIAY